MAVKFNFSRQNLALIIIMVVILLIVAGYTLFTNESDVQIRNQTDAAQALVITDETQSFTDTSGVSVTLNDYLGDIVVATSWASWCPQCSTDLPLLAEISRDYTDQEVVFLAINRSESLAMAERFLNTLPNRPDIQFVMDPSDHFFAANESYAMPETTVYDKNGTIILQQRGELRVEELRATLDKLVSP
jgi:thiol-disulfide isomerase/thioredoxin